MNIHDSIIQKLIAEINSLKELKIDLESRIEQQNQRMNGIIGKLIAEINSLKQDQDV